MKRRISTLLLSGLAVYLPLSLSGATNTWIAGSGDWSVAANWSTGAVPASTDVVVIGSGPAIAVTHSANNADTVLSIQCQQAFVLSAGSLTVTSNASQLTGSFSITSGATLEASGVGTTFSCSGPASADDANFYVSGGAAVTLPTLQAFTKECNGAYWTVTGSNSVLNLSGLTSITGEACNYPTIQAEAGGQILAPNLSSIQAGPLAFQADGTNSLINLSALTDCAGQDGDSLVTFEASGGGTMQVPNLTGGPFVGVTLNPGGTLPVAQMQTLYSLTVNGVVANFPALSNFDDGNFSVSGGGVATLPVLQNYTKDCNGANWSVTGSNSVLSLPALTNITGAVCSYPLIQAEGGGQILAANLASIEAGPLAFQADGTNSLINLSGLTNCAGQDGYLVTFEASGGGELQMPKMTGGPLVGLTLNPGGIVPVSQIQTLYSVTVNGVAVDFPDLTNFDDGNFSISDGAVVTLPVLQNYTKECNGANWTVAGSNSVLNLPALTNLTGAACSYPVIQAEAGGQIFAANLASIQAGPLAFQADGTNSLIDLNGLTNCSGQAGYFVTFEASGGGTVQIPNFTGGSLVGVTLNLGGTLPVAQMQQLGFITINGVTASFPALTNFSSGILTLNGGSVTFPALTTVSDGNITVTGGSASFPGITNFDEGSLSVSGGGVLTLPALRSYTHASCAGPTWQAQGAGSILDLSGLTNLVSSSCNWLSIQAGGGGEIILSNVTTLTNGYFYITADGTGTLVDFSNLNSAPDTAGYVDLIGSNGGEIRVPSFPGGPNVDLSLSSGAVMAVSQFDQLNSISISGMTVSFPGITNFDEGNLSVSGGGVLTLPALGSYTHSNCAGPIWQAQGAGSILDLSALTNLVSSSCNWLYIQASSGGEIILSNVTTLTNGYFNITADASGSLVDFSGLTSSPDTSGYVDLSASNDGEIRVPSFLGGPTVNVSLTSGGLIAVSQFQQLYGININGMTENFAALTRVTGGDVTLTGGSATLPILTNIDESSLSVSGGAVLALPGVRSYTHSNCGGPLWQAQDAGSILDLSGLTNLVSSSCNWLYIQASSGANITLSNVTTLTNGYFNISSSESDSLVDFSGLISSPDTSGSVDLTASDDGEIRVPSFLGGPTVNISLSSGGIMAVSQFQQLSGIAVNGMAVSFSSVTNADEGNFSVNDGGVLSLPALRSYTHSDCATPGWLAQGSGSVLDLSGLTTLVSSSCNWLYIQASGGGDIILSNLTSLATGYISILSEDPGSVIDLSQMSGMVLANGQGSVTAENGGSILLNTQAFLLANVAINIPAGNPVLPPTLIASSELTLYGQVWDSYLVEERNTLIPDSPFMFLARVPLTNSFQAIAPVPPPNTAYLVTQFVANPPELDLFHVAGQAQLVLYGLTNGTYQIQTSTYVNNTNPWTDTGGTITMTNAFRLLPPIVPSQPILFYRAKQE